MVLASLLPLHRRVLNRARLALRPSTEAASAHFVRDYRAMVRRLMADHPVDEAMSLAVGGDYETAGASLAAVLRNQGLREGMGLFDLGCGSGRLAHVLGAGAKIDYLGTDVVPELLAYARPRCPAHYRFELNTALSIPAADASVDMACAFSVFTHLQHEETYAYLAEMRRVLRPGGVVVFSFLEFAHAEHWRVFDETVEAAKASRRGHLNVFIERAVIELWSERLGFERVRFSPETPSVGTSPLGQSLAVLRRL